MKTTADHANRAHRGQGPKARAATLMLIAALAAALAAVPAVMAQTPTPQARQYSIPAGPLRDALDTLADQADLSIVYSPELVADKTTQGASGQFTPQQALRQLLTGTGLLEKEVSEATYLLRRDPAAPSESATPGNPGDQESADQLKLETVHVVGSRLPGADAMSSIVISSDDIERSGAVTVAQVLSLRPEVSVNNNGDTIVAGGFANEGSDFRTNASTVQLRGLPQGTTLVLINGRRVGGSAGYDNGVFDLSTLPLSMVERIEILPFGASAVYGGDGLGGIVNIVLKQDASGLDVRTRYEFADGYDSYGASFTWGKAWADGSLTIGGNYKNSGTLSISEREITANADYTRFGGFDLRTSTGNVYSLDGCPPPPESCFSIPVEQRGNLPGLDAPVAAIPVGQDGQNLTTESFLETAGRLQDPVTQDRPIFAPYEQYGVSINGRYQLNPYAELFADLTYTQRDLPARELSLVGSAGQFGVTVVPATNPFNPFGVDVGVDFLYEDTGVFVDFEDQYINATFGARGEWGRDEKRWEWELAAWLSKDHSDLSPNVQLFASPDAVNAALDSTDPSTALNPFRTDGGSFAPPSVIDTVFAPPDGNPNWGDFGNRLWGVNGYVRGALFQLPAGAVRALLGAEYQRETLEYKTPYSADGTDGSSVTKALFSEVRVPLLAQQDANRGELLALTGALRSDESDRFDERSTTANLGLEFRPFSSLLLRTSYSDAFKPLGLYRASVDPRGFLTPITDPQLGGQQYVVAETFIEGGIPPGLEPETSETRSLGFVYSPDSDLDLNISVTAWDSRLENRIVNPSVLAPSGGTAFQFIVDNESLFPERVTRDPETGIITMIDARPINVASTEIAGVDFAAESGFPTSAGDFTGSVAATYMYKYDERLSPTSAIQNNLGVRRPLGWAPRWKIVPSIGWAYRNELYAALTGRYVSAYEDPLPLFSGPDAGETQTLGDFWYVDLNFNLSLDRWISSKLHKLSDSRISLGVVNVFNRLPDYCNSCFGYDPSQYDIRGRFISAELKLGL